MSHFCPLPIPNSNTPFLTFSNCHLYWLQQEPPNHPFCPSHPSPACTNCQIHCPLLVTVVTFHYSNKKSTCSVWTLQGHLLLPLTTPMLWPAEALNEPCHSHYRALAPAHPSAQNAPSLGCHCSYLRLNIGVSSSSRHLSQISPHSLTLD